MTSEIRFDRPQEVGFSVKEQGQDLFQTDRLGPRLTRFFWQVVQTALFPIGIYRYFSVRTTFSAKRVDLIRECFFWSKHERVGIKELSKNNLNIFRSLVA